MRFSLEKADFHVLEPLEYKKGKVKIDSMNILNDKVFKKLKVDASTPTVVHVGHTVPRVMVRWLERLRVTYFWPEHCVLLIYLRDITTSGLWKILSHHTFGVWNP